MAQRRPIILSTMKTQLTLIAALLMIVITSCNKDCDCDDDKPPVDESYPFLRIVNDNTNEATLTSVRMLNYEFDNLNIEIGESQMFTLKKAISTRKHILLIGIDSLMLFFISPCL
jgi:hypothetical protein